VLNNQFAVANMLARLEPPLAQPHPCLQLVVINTLLTEKEEEILLIALARLALHVPVVLSGHLVLVLLIILEVDTLKKLRDIYVLGTIVPDLYTFFLRIWIQDF